MIHSAQNKKIKTFQKGFTLIELLIVIVVIGVLAGLVIVILNPTLQRNRARDSVVLATMNKIAGEAQAYSNSDITGVGNFPTCLALTGPAGGGSATTCPAVATATLADDGTLRNVQYCPCTAGPPWAATAFSFTINGVITGGDNSTTHIGFRYVPTGATAFCISAIANNPQGTNTFIRYSYPTDPSPNYQATGC